MYNIFFSIILIIFIAGFIWGQILSYLNRKRMSPEIPKDVEGIYNQEEYTKQQLYQKENSRFGLLSGSFSFIIIFLLSLIFYTFFFEHSCFGI